MTPKGSMECAVKHTGMKVYRRNRGKAPSILNLGTRSKVWLAACLNCFNTAYRLCDITL